MQGQDRYDFSPIFRHVAPLLCKADLTIGNLENPAGRQGSALYVQSSPDRILHV
ncbi:CapA family protein [Paenibacillus sp. Soil522]|uniref:CapA family protein n=1 Tax=Paenibacillus sp. Soil522 TaxID=1736388 RepID=UPI003FA6840E